MRRLITSLSAVAFIAFISCKSGKNADSNSELQTSYKTFNIEDYKGTRWRFKSPTSGASVSSHRIIEVNSSGGGWYQRVFSGPSQDPKNHFSSIRLATQNEIRSLKSELLERFDTDKIYVDIFSNRKVEFDQGLTLLGATGQVELVLAITPETGSLNWEGTPLGGDIRGE